MKQGKLNFAKMSACSDNPIWV